MEIVNYGIKSTVFNENPEVHCVHVFSSLQLEQYAEQGLHVDPLKYIPETHVGVFEQTPFNKL